MSDLFDVAFDQAKAIQQLTAERDALKAELERRMHTTVEEASMLVRELRADNERLRAEVEGMRIRFANLDAGHKMDVLRQSGDARHLTELREAAEAVRDRHELETLVTPEAMHFCTILAKLLT